MNALHVSEPAHEAAFADRLVQIRDRAYLKWEQAGRPDGLSDHFWHEAEREFGPRRMLAETSAPRKPRSPLYRTFLRGLAAAIVVSCSWPAVSAGYPSSFCGSRN